MKPAVRAFSKGSLLLVLSLLFLTGSLASDLPIFIGELREDVAVKVSAATKGKADWILPLSIGGKAKASLGSEEKVELFGVLFGKGGTVPALVVVQRPSGDFDLVRSAAGISNYLATGKAAAESTVAWNGLIALFADWKTDAWISAVIIERRGNGKLSVYCKQPLPVGARVNLKLNRSEESFPFLIQSNSGSAYDLVGDRDLPGESRSIRISVNQ